MLKLISLLALALLSPSDFKIWFDARVHADAAVYFGAPDYADKIGNGVILRRARVGVNGQVNGNWYGKFELDLANGKPAIKDALIRYTGVPGLEVQAGHFKEFFSIQVNTSSRHLQFMERPMVATTLAPSRHLGLNARYAKDWLWVSAGCFGPQAGSADQWENMVANNKNGYNAGYSLTGKLVFRPLYKQENASLHLGAAVSYRTPKSSDAVYGSYRGSTRNSTNINQKKYLDSGYLDGYRHTFLWTVEVAGHWKGLRAEAAYTQSQLSFAPDAPDPSGKVFRGWYAQAGYLLLGGSQSYDAKGGKYTEIKSARKWGDLELCARYEYFDLNSGRVYGGAGEAFALGLNWWVNRHVKMQLNYQYNNNDRYANGDGTLFVGRDAAGAPTRDYRQVVAPRGRAGVDYHMLAVRLEIDF